MNLRKKTRRKRRSSSHRTAAQDQAWKRNGTLWRVSGLKNNLDELSRNSDCLTGWERGELLTAEASLLAVLRNWKRSSKEVKNHV